MSQHVLVIGPAEESLEIVFALRERGIEAWSDRMGRVAPDFVSFDWADGLVVIDDTPHVECRHLRPVMEFPGARLLATPTSLEPDERATLLDRGFDGIVAWPAPAELVAAYLDRFLSRSALPRRERMRAS